MISSFYVTSKGQEYIARSIADRALVFTRGEFGNGVLQEDPITITQLVNTVGPLPISRKETDKSNLIIATQFSNMQNGSILPAFKLTEVGLFGKLQTYAGVDDQEKPETLLLYGYVPEEQADTVQDVLTEYIMTWPITISGEATIKVEINDSMAYPTLEEYNSAVSHKIEAEGTGGALTGTSDLPLDDEMQVTVKLPADLQDGATFSLNGGTALPIMKLDGEPVEEGPKEGTYLNLIYSAADNCWYMMGGGGTSDITKMKGTLAIEHGGTNATTAEQARKNLGITAANLGVYTKEEVNKITGDIGAVIDEMNGIVV